MYNDEITSTPQKDNINTVIERFSMSAASSPMDPDIDLGNTSYQDKTVSKDLCMSLVRFLMYLALVTWICCDGA